jgi:hypothetical protein
MVSEEPESRRLYNEEGYVWTRDGVEFYVYPVATYYLVARIASIAYYSNYPWGLMSPCDLALIWGRLVRPQNLRRIRFWQSDRWYHWDSDGLGDDLTHDYVVSHSSNNHIVPAIPEVFDLCDRLAKGMTVEIEGFLADLEADDGRQRYSWRTSTSRHDTQGGSCEIIYVEHMRIVHEDYEADYQNGSGSYGRISCPHCGHTPGYKSYKCYRCGASFYNDGFPTGCPECGTRWRYLHCGECGEEFEI